MVRLLGLARDRFAPSRWPWGRAALTCLGLALLSALGAPAQASGSADPTLPPSGLPPDRIVIPSIGLDAPVVPVPLDVISVGGQLVGQYEVPGFFAAGWHEGSAGLGVPGNSVFGGHSDVYGEVFRRLPEASLGDVLLVYSGQRQFAYRITFRAIVRESGQPLSERLANARWIAATTDERVTLVTCWPYPSNTHRLIVVAQPLWAALPITGPTGSLAISSPLPHTPAPFPPVDPIVHRPYPYASLR